MPRLQVSLRLSYDSGDHETKWDAITRLDTLVRTTNAIHLEGNRSCMTTLVRVWRSPATAPVQWYAGHQLVAGPPPAMAASCTALHLTWHGPGLVSTHTVVNGLPVGFRSAHFFPPSLLLYPIILKWSPVDEKSRILIIHKNLKSGTWIKRHATNGTAVNTDVGRCVSAIRTRGGGFGGRAGGAATPPNKIMEEQNYLFAPPPSKSYVGMSCVVSQYLFMYA